MQKISQSQVVLLTSVIVVVAVVVIGFILSILFFGLHHNRALPTKHQNDPSLQGSYKKNLKIELVTGGLFYPTSMAFVDDNKILVLEKNTGLVRLISDGVLQDKPVFRLPIDNKAERGLLGIAVLHRNNNKTDAVNTNVFLYFTESNTKSSSNIKNDEQLSNRIYKYDWNGKSLVSPTLIFNLPPKPGLYHDGGKLVIGPENNLYTVIEDLNSIYGTAQNHDSRRESNGSSGILRINPINGSPVKDSPFIPQYSENNNTNNARLTPYYYAYGIRNSFGIAFDPASRILWDTENGEDKYDEINIDKPGFNSGWHKIMGPISANNMTEKDLISVPGSHYSDPVFSWYHSIGVTDIEFLKSSKLGEIYRNNIFVGDINNGNLYYFQLNETRTGLKFNLSGLNDMVVDNKNELSGITFASGFKGITDI